MSDYTLFKTLSTSVKYHYMGLLADRLFAHQYIFLVSCRIELTSTLLMRKHTDLLVVLYWRCYFWGFVGSVVWLCHHLPALLEQRFSSSFSFTLAALLFALYSSSPQWLSGYLRCIIKTYAFF